MNMRRTPGVMVISPRIRTGLDGDESVVAGSVRLRAARSGKIRIQRRRMLVAHMDVAAAGIGLPKLDQRIRNAPAILIQDMTMDDDAFAERLALVLRGK